VDARGAPDEGAVLRTAKPCGPDASVQASSGRSFSPVTVSTSRSPGRARS